MMRLYVYVYQFGFCLLIVLRIYRTSFYGKHQIHNDLRRFIPFYDVFIVRMESKK